MSIVEKAVGKLGTIGTAPSQEAPAATQAEKPKPQASRKVTRSEHIVDTKAAAKRGLISFADYPALAHEFRFLKRPVLARVFGSKSKSEDARHRLLITSDLPGAGKSFVAFNLAASIAQEQLVTVVLIDGDPLRRNLTEELDQESRPGLMEVLVDSDVDPRSVILDTDLPNLKFIPAGQPRENSTELLASQRLPEALDEIDDSNTVILIDSPPLLLTAEARVLVDMADHALVVVEAGRTSTSDVAAVLKMIGESESSIGFILNKAPRTGLGRDAGYYGYGYGYSYRR